MVLTRYSIQAGTKKQEIAAESMLKALTFFTANNVETPEAMAKIGTTVTAEDVEDPAVTFVNASPSSGVVYPADTSVSEGSDIIITAVPSADFVFTSFSVVMAGSATTYTDNPLKLRVVADAQVTVAWAAE